MTLAMNDFSELLACSYLKFSSLNILTINDNMMVGSLAQWWHHLSHECRYSMLSTVSTEMGDHLWAGIPPWYVIKPTRLTQSYIPLGLLNRVPALIGWSKGGNVTSARWLFDPIWHVSSLSDEAR